LFGKTFPSQYANESAKTNDTIAINFINIFIDGPDVSFNGSPTVSPTTAYLYDSVFLNPCASNPFLQLSHAPPLLLILIAICTPDTIPPANNPTVH